MKERTFNHVTASGEFDSFLIDFQKEFNISFPEAAVTLLAVTWEMKWLVDFGDTIVFTLALYFKIQQQFPLL